MDNYKRIVQVDLAVECFEQDGIFYHYSPELDLFGYGKSDEEAKESFDVSLGIYLAYAREHNKSVLGRQ